MKIKVKKSELKESIRNAVVRVLSESMNETIDEICFSTVDDDPDELEDFFVGSRYHGDDKPKAYAATKRVRRTPKKAEPDEDEVVRRAMRDKGAKRAAMSAMSDENGEGEE
jgi:hypothetical protein